MGRFFRIAERTGTETKGANLFRLARRERGFEANKIERIIPFYPFSRDRAKLSSILRTLAIYRLAFGQPRQSELIEHLLKHIPEDRIGEVRKKLMVNLSPISYRSNGSDGEPNLGIVQVRDVAKGDSGESPSPGQKPKSAIESRIASE